MSWFHFAALAGLLLAAPVRAELLVSANDNKMVLEDGKLKTIREPKPDTLAVFDLSSSPPTLRGEIEVPASVVGPPTSVAITPDARLALVTANQRPDPAEPGKLVPGTTLAVIDLSVTPPKLVQTLNTGAGPAGISINKAGTLALVANRAEGSVSVFRIGIGQISQVGKVDVGTVGSEVSSIAFTPDGKRAIVTRNGDHSLNVLQIEGEKVTKLDREMTAGVRPYGLAVLPDGRYAVVGNLGRGTGDVDTVSLVDLQKEPWRIVDTLSIGQTPEGIAASPDGRFIAVTVINGSNKSAASPFHGKALVKLLRIENGRLQVVSEAPVGGWPQGAAFSADGRALFVGSMAQRNITVLRIEEDGKLNEAGPALTVGGGSAALAVAQRAK